LDILEDQKLDNLWNKVTPQDKESIFGGQKNRFKQKVQKRINDAIEAYIGEGDGSSLSEEEQLAKKNALKKFYKFSKWLGRYNTTNQ